MDLAFVPPLYPPKGNRAIYEVKPFSSALHRNLYSQRTSPCLATAATQTSQASEFVVENKKHDLLRAILETKRGLVATADQRSSIEEALVSVEGYNMGLPIDLVKLDGTWRLQYTSAPDVLILFEAAARLPFFQEQEGATLLVSAKFDIVSARNIYLQFEEITIQNINVSEELQALIAPAILPRSFLSLQILQFIRTFRAQIPVGNPGRQSVGGLYYLSYLDDNMLLGRAVGGGGVFVFTRAQPLE
ncbi:probable plastid-lipid-associated protein 10, chloroplastic isoform X2 [Quercus robur]|uniref:probable plastid-lipid-associated protein 10, chloroplastic isoform X2 n=1 Tax=Quercus robur TaxID=38942 RepID=UPI002162CC39|nr:probable plastid-lipid-associated protein 10, chloroplastic isoform X2 [Quercus robur]